MKKISYSLLIVLLCTITVFGQEVKIIKDTVYVDQIPVFLYKKAYSQDKSIRSMNNIELLYVKKVIEAGVVLGSELIFMDSGEKVFFKPDFYIDKEITTKLVLDEVIKGDSIYPEGKRRFLMKYGENMRQPVTVGVVDMTKDILKEFENLITTGKVNPGTTYNLVERNRTAQVFVFGNKIQQDFKEIGTYSKTTKLSDGKNYTVVSIYLPDKTLVCQATYETFNASSCRITTLKDNKIHSIQLINKLKEVEEIAAYLSVRYYL